MCHHMIVTFSFNWIGFLFHFHYHLFIFILVFVFSFLFLISLLPSFALSFFNFGILKCCAFYWCIFMDFLSYAVSTHTLHDCRHAVLPYQHYLHVHNINIWLHIYIYDMVSICYVYIFTSSCRLCSFSCHFFDSPLLFTKLCVVLPTFPPGANT